MIEFDKMLRDKNLKATPQRLAIVEGLHDFGHLSIDEIYEMVKAKFPSISLATVYKNINSMFDKSFVKEIKIPDQKSKYELTKEKHSHLVCSQCKKVEDIHLDLDALIVEASKKSDFKIRNDAVVLTGVCPDCAS